MKKTLLSVFVAGILSFGIVDAKTYNIDNSHSNVSFKISHMSVSTVDGSFSDFKGVVEIDPKTKTLTKLEGEIQMAKINTRSEKRDAHLQGAEYLDTAKFPTGTLKATKVTKGKKGIVVDADLTLKGVTKKVKLSGDLKGPITNPMSKKETFGLVLEGTINRKDFGIAKDTSSVTMGEEVSISISLELVE